jgi:hypothetical protein
MDTKDMSGTSKMNGLAVSMLIVGLIVGFLVGWFWQKHAAANNSQSAAVMNAMTGSSTDTTGDDSMMMNGSASGENTTAMAGSQASNSVMTGTMQMGTMPTYGSPDKTIDEGGAVGSVAEISSTKVSVADVTLQSNGWVAVRDIVNGKLGNILGAQYMTAGTYPTVTVNLLRALTAGKTYEVVIYRDNGDRVFGKNSDYVVVQNGQPISTTFSAH